MKKYKVKCYNKSGDLDHEEFCDMLAQAETIRKNWGLKIGLRPEPSMDFAKYPTIWVLSNNGEWKRVEGY